MYHGEIVPGFPMHPHRGFETVTVVRRGLLDHSDSMGATARYGRGDVQWLTAGRGIQHAEMFPLTERERDNPLELFQIWLNLPIRDKMAEPYFSMLWSNTIPKHVVRDSEGRTVEIMMTGGHYGDVRAPAPPPSSWAAHADSNVAIWTIKLAPHARFTLPAAPGTNRSLYFFRGQGLDVDGHAIPVQPPRRAARRAGRGADRGLRRDRGAAAAGQADRRAGRPLRPVRDDDARGDPPGDRRLPAHAVRRLAVGQRRSGARARGRPLRRRPDGKTERPA
jgi:redox-sensitive bicupin YhaK (pirin superfamily)